MGGKQLNKSLLLFVVTPTVWDKVKGKFSTSAVRPGDGSNPPSDLPSRLGFKRTYGSSAAKRWFKKRPLVHSSHTFGRNRESRSREATGRRNWPEAAPRKMSGRKRAAYRTQQDSALGARSRQQPTWENESKVRCHRRGAQVRQMKVSCTWPATKETCAQPITIVALHTCIVEDKWLNPS